MADPVTIMAGVSMAGGVINAMGVQSQAEGQAAANNFNAAVADRDARLARESAEYDASIQDKHGRMALGAMRAAFGSSGFSSDGALDIMAMSVESAEKDKLAILHQGELKAMGYEDTARLNRQAAKQAKEAGQWGMVSSLLTSFTGAGKLLTAGNTAGSAGTPIAT